MILQFFHRSACTQLASTACPYVGPVNTCSSSENPAQLKSDQLIAIIPDHQRFRNAESLVITGSDVCPRANSRLAFQRLALSHFRWPLSFNFSCILIFWCGRLVKHHVVQESAACATPWGRRYDPAGETARQMNRPSPTHEVDLRHYAPDSSRS